MFYSFKTTMAKEKKIVIITLELEYRNFKSRINDCPFVRSLTLDLSGLVIPLEAGPLPA